MRLFRFFWTIGFISIGLISLGQSIETKVKTIDSLSNSIDNNKELVEGISEGTILNKRGKNIGGYSTYDLKDNTNLYRIRNYVSTDHYYKTTFYYYNKKIIKATVIIENWKPNNTVETTYSADYYFDNNQVIKSNGENKKYSNSINILEQGQKFQTEFKN
jgi:hypothetical protein